MELDIVPFNSSHLDAVLEIEFASFSPPWSRDTFKYTLEDEFSYYIVALDGEGEVVGYAGIRHVLGEANLDNIAVAPRHLHEGVGKKLLEGIIEQCRQLHITKLMLEVRMSNLPAINLYKNHGFVEAGVRKNYYTKPEEDAILLDLYL